MARAKRYVSAPFGTGLLCIARGCYARCASSPVELTQAIPRGRQGEKMEAVGVCFELKKSASLGLESSSFSEKEGLQIFKMKRLLLPNTGANLKNTQVAIALGIAECEKLGVQDFTVVAGTKETFESTEIGKLLGDTAKNLAKGEAVEVDSQGHKVQLESVATIQKLHTARVVIALHLSADHIQKLEDLPIDVLIFVPWSETEGNTWTAKWGAETVEA